MNLAQQSAGRHHVLESSQHNTQLAVLSEVSENAWSVSPARRRSRLTLKQVRHRGNIKRLYVLKPLGCRGKNSLQPGKTKLINGLKVQSAGRVSAALTVPESETKRGEVR